MTLSLGEWAPETMSVAEKLAVLPEEQRKAFESQLSKEQRVALEWDWDFWARPDQQVPDDCSLYIRSSGRGSGKALDCLTPLPTPTGWTTMGAVKVGNFLFDDRGDICEVTFATPIQYARRCYEMVFSDGSSIVADADHLWLTWTHAARKAARRRVSNSTIRNSNPRRPECDPAVRSTDTIRATLVQGKRGDRNHSVPVAKPLDLGDADLPIPPYTLGAWLGDGTSTGGELTTADTEVLEFIAADGFTPRYSRPAGGRSSVYSLDLQHRPDKVGWPRDPLTGRLLPHGGLTGALKAAGLLRNKHIPPIYLRGSIEQRQALLEGLMDTDGYADPGPRAMVEFVSTREALAEGVYELVVSLGHRATILKGTATLNGIEIGPKWRVCWRPTGPVFRLPRKLASQRPLGAQAGRHGHRMIVAVREVPTRAVRCITVDSPNHLFLAGRSMIPTHNTREGAEWVRQKGPRHAEGLLIGANPRDARDLMLEGRSGVLTVSPPWERPVYEPTKLMVRWPNGAIAHVRSAEDPGGIRGLSVEYLWADEIVKWRFLQETWDQARLALREGSHPQTVVTTTPMPLPLIKKLLAGGRGVVVRPPVSTYRNAANLSPDYLRELLETYEGTRLGDQELHAKVLDDVKGALWNAQMIEGARWKGEWVETPSGLVPDLAVVRRRVLGVDPSGSTTGDEWGLIVSGADNRRPSTGFVLDDRSQRGSPEECGRAAVKAYVDHDCEAMVAEVNYGGEMVERVIRATPAFDSGGKSYPSGENVRIKVVRAGRGQSKYQRAVPIVGLYEQNLRGFQRIFHVGNFPELANQMTTWVPAEMADGIEVFASKWSPDRVDAMVWGMLHLLVLEARRQGRSEGDALRSATIA